MAVVVGVIVWATALAAWRTQRAQPCDRAPGAHDWPSLYPIQAVIGGLQVLTGLAAWTQTLHLALGAVIWGLAAGLAVVAYLEARTAVTVGPGCRLGAVEAGGRRGRARRRRIGARPATPSAPTSP